MAGARDRRRRGTSAALLALALLVAFVLAPAAGAATARDRPDTPGPLDLVKVEVGQQETKLKVRIGVSSPLPRLRELRPHPAFEKGKAERYLCLNLASHSIGRRLYCPAGDTKRGHVAVGVNVVGKRGIRGNGSVAAKVERSKRGLVLRFGLGALGIESGQLSFSATTSWYGPACVPKGSRGATRLRRPGAAQRRREDADLSGPAGRLHRPRPAHRSQRSRPPQVGGAHLRRRPEPLHRRRAADPRSQTTSTRRSSRSASRSPPTRASSGRSSPTATSLPTIPGATRWGRARATSVIPAT